MQQSSAVRDVRILHRPVTRPYTKTRLLPQLLLVWCLFAPVKWQFYIWCSRCRCRLQTLYDILKTPPVSEPFQLQWVSVRTLLGPLSPLFLCT